MKVAEKQTAAKQVRAIKALLAAQKASKMTVEAKATEAKLVTLELALDVEYKKTVPPFKPAKYEGRKEKDANRVAVLELFTGAQCPPCVAADVAFDALEKSYDHKDLVLIQYHMHIPGPDPLTNADSIARWDFYQKKSRTPSAAPRARCSTASPARAAAAAWPTRRASTTSSPS